MGGQTTCTSVLKSEDITTTLSSLHDDIACDIYELNDHINKLHDYFFGDEGCECGVEKAPSGEIAKLKLLLSVSRKANMTLAEILDAIGIKA